MDVVWLIVFLAAILIVGAMHSVWLFLFLLLLISIAFVIGVVDTIKYDAEIRKLEREAKEKSSQ